MFGLGPSELFIVGIVAILLFGKNLPQVAAKLGRTYRDFRRQLSDMQSQLDITADITAEKPRSKPRSQKTYSDYDDYDDISAPKFEPPPAPPEASGGSSP